jgi:hypothetical protein
MRKGLFAFLLLAIVFTACEKEDSPELRDGSVEFLGNSAVIHARDMSNIRLKNLPGSVTFDENVPEGQIHVKASAGLDKWLEVKEEGGELRLEGKDGLPLTLHLHPHDIAKIVVEGDNRVEITSTPVFDHLELVTEGESELIIHDLKVRHLVSRREGKSRMFLSNELLSFNRDSVYFPVSGVQVLNERFIVYEENDLTYLLWAPQVKVRNDSVFAVLDTNARTSEPRRILP